MNTKAYKNKEKLVQFLESEKKNKAEIWNRWREFLYSKNILKLDLSNSNLSNSDLRNTDFRYSDLSNSDLRNTDLRYSCLRYSNLRNTDLSNSDLIGADLDFSCLYFSCKTLYANFDDRQLIQILYHFAKPASNSINCKDEDIKKLLKLKTFLKVVNKFHRVDECGRI
jgi:uncharacterized protein YjbI with pentapeptide repeats